MSLHAIYGFLNTRIRWWMQWYNWLKLTCINRQHNCDKNQGQGVQTFTHQTKMIKASVGLDYFCLKCGLVLFSVWVKCSGGFLICFKQSLSFVSHWEVMKLVCFTQGHIVGGFSMFTEKMLFLWLVETKVVCFMQIYLFGVCFDQIWSLMQFSITSPHVTSCPFVYICFALLDSILTPWKRHNSKINGSHAGSAHFSLLEKPKLFPLNLHKLACSQGIHHCDPLIPKISLLFTF